MKPEERKRERNRQEKKRESADGSIPDPVKPQMRVTRFNLILSMMRSFNRRTGSVRSRMRILSAGIILALLGTHSVGAKREETKDDSLSLSLSLSRGGEAPARSSQKPTTQKTHEDQGPPRKPREAQQEEDGAFTTHLLISHN